MKLKHTIAIIITALLIGILIGYYVWTDSSITLMDADQLEAQIEFMDMFREYLEDSMRWYDEAVEWNRRAREEGEKMRLKQGIKE